MKAKITIKQAIFVITTVIFILSLYFWISIIRDLIDVYFNGTNAALIESLSDHKWYYGWDAVKHLWEIDLFAIFLFLWPIPVYQIVYIVVMAISQPWKTLCSEYDSEDKPIESLNDVANSKWEDS